nr:hypothetical protein [Bacteroidota bacterium]
HWINDHLDGSENGGCANFYASYSSANQQLPAGTPEAGKYVLPTLSTYANHALCVCGYHDSIRWDYNNDGQYTNHIDINNDGVVNLLDWEIGGVKLANSYSATSWGNNGFAYLMYNALCRNLSQGGVWNRSVSVINAKENTDPQVTYKVVLTHDTRNEIKVMAGISPEANATEPEFVIDFPILNYQGGSKYMQGGTSQADKTLEFGLDVTPLLGYVESSHEVTFFIMVNEKDGDNTSTGSLDAWSVMDYTNGLVEITYQQTLPQWVENGTTILAMNATIDFDAPQVLNVDLPPATINEPYENQMLGTSGTEPYWWNISQQYDYSYSTAPFPNVSQEQLYPNNQSTGYATKEIDFAFPCYGKFFTEISIHTDGFLMFDEQKYPWTFLTDEFALFKNMKNISVLMCNPLSLGGGGMWYEGDASSATFRWKTSEYSTGNAQNFAVTLYPSGKIEFYYGECVIAAWNEWHAGISEGNSFNYNHLDISNTYNFQPNQKVTLEPQYHNIEMQITPEGLFYGLPTQPYEAIDVNFHIKDNNGLRSLKTLPFFTNGINSIVIREVIIQAGDNDIIEYGENVSLGVELQNISDDVVNALEMKITTYDEYVTLIDSLVTLSTFQPGQSIIFEDAFNFDVSMEVPDSHDMIFDTEISSTVDTYTSHIYLKAYAPNLVIGNVTIDDGGNGYLEPGETAQVYVEIQNFGGGIAHNVSATLENSDPYFTITQGSFQLGEISGNGLGTAEFEIYVDESTPIGYTTIFSVEATADFGFEASDSFTIAIGFVVEDFESGSFDIYEWGFSGEAPWSITDNIAYEGIYCMKSGTVSDLQSSVAFVTMDVIADGEISFYFKVSSEATYDFLNFYIDGSAAGSWSGEVGWTQATASVTAGEHVFKWEYKKDYSVSNGSDCAWVDFIVFPPSVQQTLAVSAGQDMDICENDSPELNGLVQNATSVEWTTSGDGTFSDNTIVNPTYTPGSNDISNGSVSLTLTGYGNSKDSMSDDMMLYISRLPIVWAGDDVSYCNNIEEIEVDGTVVNTDEFLWLTDGDGTFDDPYELQTIYHPGTDDISSGSVQLSLTGYSVEPCSDEITHGFEVALLPLP